MDQGDDPGDSTPVEHDAAGGQQFMTRRERREAERSGLIAPESTGAAEEAPEPPPVSEWRPVFVPEPETPSAPAWQAPAWQPPTDTAPAVEAPAAVEPPASFDVPEPSEAPESFEPPAAFEPPADFAAPESYEPPPAFDAPEPSEAPVHVDAVDASRLGPPPVFAMPPRGLQQVEPEPAPEEMTESTSAEALAEAPDGAPGPISDDASSDTDAAFDPFAELGFHAEPDDTDAPLAEGHIPLPAEPWTGDVPIVDSAPPLDEPLIVDESAAIDITAADEPAFVPPPAGEPEGARVTPGLGEVADAADATAAGESGAVDEESGERRADEGLAAEAFIISPPLPAVPGAVITGTEPLAGTPSPGDSAVPLEDPAHDDSDALPQPEEVASASPGGDVVPVPREEQAVVGELPPPVPATTGTRPLIDYGELGKPTTAERASLLLAILVPPVGLVMAIVMAVRSSRSRGFTIPLNKAAIVVGVLMTALVGLAVFLTWEASERAKQHDGVVAASAEFCAAVQADPATLAPPLYSWPRQGTTIDDTLNQMQEFVDRWTSYGAVAPDAVADGVLSIADRGRELIDTVNAARQIDDEQNTSLMRQTIEQSGVGAWVAAYCPEATEAGAATEGSDVPAADTSSDEANAS